MPKSNITIVVLEKMLISHAKIKKEMVPSRIELLILALLAPRLNQLGQGTNIKPTRLLDLFVDIPNTLEILTTSIICKFQ